MEVANQESISNAEASVKDSQSVAKRKKGVFPRLPLKKVLLLPRAIYTIGQGEPVRRLKVFDHLGKAPASGPSRLLVTVSGMYGLTNGGFQAEYLDLTDLGRKIIETEDIGLIYDVLFKNEIFSKFIEYWKDKALPADDIAADWLLRTFRLNVDDAKGFWDVIKENIFDYNLIEELSGKQVVISKEIALQSQTPTISPTEVFPPIKQEADQTMSSSLATVGKHSSESSSETAEIKLENGGFVKIIMYKEGEITKKDAKKMKTQIDIYSDFIDKE